MTKLELKESLINLREELKTIISNGQAEQRELNETETARMAEIRSQIDETEAKIAKMDSEEEKLAQRNNTKDNKQIRTMKLTELINSVANGTVTDEQRAYVNGNKISFRGINVTTEKEGQENVPEEKKGLDVAIRNASVLNKIGCTWFGNAVGDISIPHYSGSQVGWKGEVAAADAGEGEFAETVLKPKRLTAYVDVSKTFLAQDSNDAEAILIADLAAAVAEKLDATVFGAEAGTDDKPAGIFAEATATEALDDVEYKDILALEAEVEGHNGTNFMFIANPQVKYALKGTQMASGLAMVYDKNEIDGYKAVVSNSVADKGIVCMDPRDLAVATWGGVDITVDTTSRAIYNEVRLVVNFLCDAKLRGDRVAVALFN